MRDEKFARSAAAALIVLPIALVPLHLLFGLGFARAALLYGLGCAALGIAVSLALGRRSAALQILAAALPAAALAYAVPVGIPGAQTARAIMAGAGALLAVWSERLSVTADGDALKPGLLLAPLLTLLAASAFTWYNGRSGGDGGMLMGTLLLLAVLWFAVSVFLLNRISSRTASRAGAHRDIPPAVRRFGAIGTAVFLAAALLLGSVGAIAAWLGAAFRALARWVMEALLFLGGLFGMGGTEQGEAPQSPDMGLPDAASNNSPLMELITNILIAAVFVAAAVALLYGLYRLLPRLWKKLRQRLGDLFASWREEDYHDQSESLMSLRQALNGAGDRFRKFARRFRRRPRYADCRTNTERVRFLFREWLCGLISAGHEPPPSATASDIARSAPALAQAYNRARYGGEEPEDGEVEKAKEEVSGRTQGS